MLLHGVGSSMRVIPGPLEGCVVRGPRLLCVTPDGLEDLVGGGGTKSWPRNMTELVTRLGRVLSLAPPTGPVSDLIAAFPQYAKVPEQTVAFWDALQTAGHIPEDGFLFAKHYGSTIDYSGPDDGSTDTSYDQDHSDPLFDRPYWSDQSDGSTHGLGSSTSGLRTSYNYIEEVPDPDRIREVLFLLPSLIAARGLVKEAHRRLALWSETPEHPPLVAIAWVENDYGHASALFKSFFSAFPDEDPLFKVSSFHDVPAAASLVALGEKKRTTYRGHRLSALRPKDAGFEVIALPMMGFGRVEGVGDLPAFCRDYTDLLGIHQNWRMAVDAGLKMDARVAKTVPQAAHLKGRLFRDLPDPFATLGDLRDSVLGLGLGLADPTPIFVNSESRWLYTIQIPDIAKPMLPPA